MPLTSPTRRQPKRTRIHHLRELKERGERWPMLTAYDAYTAEIFDEAGMPVLLVGDSAANNVYGYDKTLPVSVEELLPLATAVVRGPATRWSSPTCRSAATRSGRSRRWRPPSGS